MKKIIIVSILMSFSLISLAQNPRFNKIEQARVAILSTKLNLTEQQAIKFWPIYNEYMEKLKSIHDRKKKFSDILSNSETATDQELDKALTDLFSAQEEEIQLKKKYRVEFGKVLSMRQVAYLWNAERQFREMIVDRITRSDRFRGRRGN